MTPSGPGSGDRTDAVRAAAADIHVEIDELDLTGVPASRRHQVAATFERELRRLLADSTATAWWERDRSADRPRTVSLSISPDANPVLVGEALARSVMDGLR